MMPLTEELRRSVVQDYCAGISSSVVATSHGIHQSTVCHIVRRAGREVRRPSTHRIWSFNEHFFDEIDSEAKAYFLGLLYADGYNNTKLGNVEISLNAEDRSLLDALSIAIAYTGRIKDRAPKYAGCQPMCRLVLCSRFLSESLSRAGCMTRKSQILTFPTWMTAALRRHFIRGYFDGDGCIYLHTRPSGPPQAMWSIIGTEAFCRGVQDEMREAIGIQGHVHRHQFAKAHSLAYCGNRIARTIRRYIYDECTIALDRKRRILNRITPGKLVAGSRERPFAHIP